MSDPDPAGSVPPLVLREYRRAGLARRIAHLVIAYITFFVVAFAFIIALSVTMWGVAAAMGRPEFDPMGDSVLPWVDRSIAVGSWFFGMLGAIVVHRVLSRSYALVGRPTRCAACGNVLRGLTEPVCPTCGVRL